MTTRSARKRAAAHTPDASLDARDTEAPQWGRLFAVLRNLGTELAKLDEGIGCVREQLNHVQSRLDAIEESLWEEDDGEDTSDEEQSGSEEEESENTEDRAFINDDDIESESWTSNSVATADLHRSLLRAQ